jgi:membrane-associated phospholipid phosphatase
MNLERLLDPRTDGQRPRSPIALMLGGYAVMTVVLLGVGLLLTHTLAHTVGRWDEHVNEHFARTRSQGWNGITQFATEGLNTAPVVVGAALVSAFLLIRHRFREAAFLVLALVLEITVFLSVTFLVARPRPDVPRMNSTPATSSFPSGHTAAATVFFVGLAVLVMYCSRRWAWRVLASVLAIGVPVLVGFARVYRGLHHPTDVVVGALFGLCCLLVSALVVRAFEARRRARSAPVESLPARAYVSESVPA